MYKKLFKSESNRGFTLIEMLVVLAIMGILSGIIITNLSSAKSKARDSRRVSDISHLQLALQMYLDRCGKYPPNVTTEAGGGGVGMDNRAVGQGGTSTTCNREKSTGGYYSMSDFIATIPSQPSTINGMTVYAYIIDPIKPYSYVLFTPLESANATAMKDSLTDDITISNVTYPCGGTGGTNYCVGPN